MHTLKLFQFFLTNRFMNVKRMGESEKREKERKKEKMEKLKNGEWVIEGREERDAERKTEVNATTFRLMYASLTKRPTNLRE